MEQPHITFLDSSTMDAGDIDFSPLEALGRYTSYPTTMPDEILGRLAQTDVVIVNKVVLGKDEIEGCPNLKMIQLSATGFNKIGRAHV